MYDSNPTSVLLDKTKKSQRTEILSRLYGLDFNLIPVNGKHPPCIEWKPYQTRRVTPEEIKQWMRGRFPTQSSGLAAVQWPRKGQLYGFEHCALRQERTVFPALSKQLFGENRSEGSDAVVYQRALRINEQALGADHQQVALNLNNLAELYRTQGKYAEAEPLYQRAYKIFKAALGLEHPNTKTVLNNYAEFLMKAERQDKLIPLIPDLKVAFPGIFAEDAAANAE